VNTFRVALSGDFLKSDGTPAYPMFDLEPLRREPGVEVAYVHAVDRVMRAEDLEDFDALILLGSRFEEGSIPRSGRLAIVARFGVGYDTVDVPACTRAGIAVVITPDGIRRPVAVSVLTLMLALATRLMAKDRLTRMGPPGWALRSESWAWASRAARSAFSGSATSVPTCSASPRPSTCALSRTIPSSTRPS
jgi:lactate dehydrogenase-like 2-hydroxyacid dehydrogenase